jgi:hypothetical protein
MMPEKTDRFTYHRLLEKMVISVLSTNELQLFFPR